MMTQATPNAIDAVITWVDGSDPAHQEKLRSYMSDIGKNHQAAHPTRFSSVNEIQYCITSILKFAPFIRKIFIVTDHQKPDIEDHLKKHFPHRLKDVIITDHKDVFRGYESYLPIFNSTAIESMLWRIPGLADRFVYFNDDFFLIREVKPEDWFKEHLPVLRGRWMLAPYRKILSNKIKSFIHRNVLKNKNYQPRFSFYLRQYNAARLLGFTNRFFFHSHGPYPLNRKRLEDFYREREDILISNIGHRFRSPHQFISICLANHLEMVNHNTNFAKRNTIYVDPHYHSAGKVQRKLQYCEENTGIQSVCMQSLDMTTPENQQMIFRWMDNILNIQ